MLAARVAGVCVACYVIHCVYRWYVLWTARCAAVQYYFRTNFDSSLPPDWIVNLGVRTGAGLHREYDRFVVDDLIYTQIHILVGECNGIVTEAISLTPDLKRWFETDAGSLLWVGLRTPCFLAQLVTTWETLLSASAWRWRQ
jgi:hypothetical protein